ncbi:MAG TPA: ribonuclease HI family protein [Patescibacteria group bacterium]|nr:ribonuclease HI family protein [Patescibacteria group bacterium]
MDLIINTDGASRGNPGPASYGFVLKSKDGPILHEEGEQIGITTNNVAEYTAVIKAFDYIIKKFFRKAPHKIEVVSDSRLVVEQLSGRFKIKSPNLMPLFDKIKTMEFELGRVFYRSVPREENFLADRLANRAFEK